MFQLVIAKDEFEHKTQRVNEKWQTDFTQFKVVDWGYYYLCTILDIYSRYILGWRLLSTKGSRDVEEILNLAVANTGVEHVCFLMSICLLQAGISGQFELASPKCSNPYSKCLMEYILQKQKLFHPA